jgi:hypothetical protein
MQQILALFLHVVPPAPLFHILASLIDTIKAETSGAREQWGPRGKSDSAPQERESKMDKEEG